MQRRGSIFLLVSGAATPLRLLSAQAAQSSGLATPLILAAPSRLLLACLGG